MAVVDSICYFVVQAAFVFENFLVVFVEVEIVAVALEWGDCSVVDRSSSARGFLVALFGYLPVVVAAALDWRYYFV